MRLAIPLVLFSLAVLPAYGQSDAELDLQSRVDSLALAQDWPALQRTTAELLAAPNTWRQNYYWAAVAYVHREKPDSALGLLRIALQKGLHYSAPGKANQDVFLEPLQTHPAWPRLEAAFDSSLAAANARFSQSMLDKMVYYRDRTADALRAAAEEGVAPDSVVKDRFPQEILLKDLDELGFPTLDRVGPLGQRLFFAALGVCDLATKVHVLQLAQIVLPYGGVDRSEYAQLEDFVNVELGKPQRFGTRYVRDSATARTLRLAPLKKPGRVAAWRQLMRLPPVAEQHLRLKSQGFTIVGAED